MLERPVMEILRSTGAILEGHFVYKSWKHGTQYINKNAVFPHPRETARLCLEIARWFQDDDIKTVIAPAVGAVTMSQLIAEHLTEITGREVFSVYAEKKTIVVLDPDKKGRRCFCETGEFIIGRDYEKYVAGNNVLVVEDVLNTGASVRGVVKAVRDSGGTVVGVGALCNRGKVTKADVGNVPKLVALARIDMQTLSEDDCKRFGPCSKGIPINTNVGHGREFLEQENKRSRL